MYTIKSCPVCSKESFSPFITCEDYTVSHERFDIQSCNNCNFKFTNPRPEDSKLGEYYKSDDYISHSDTRKGLISQMYHTVRKRTLKKKLQLVSSYVSRGTILDYGCGTGSFLNECWQAGWKAFGVEPDKGARKIAFEAGLNVSENKLIVEQKSKDLKFNAITLWHVLEHITDLNETLAFFKSKLNREGVIIIAVPNYKSFDATHYGEHWAAYDVPRHLYHFEKETLEKLMLPYGFTLVNTYPMKFDSFYVSMLSEKYRTGKINYFNAFWNGLKSNLSAKSSADYSSVIYVFQ